MATLTLRQSTVPAMGRLMRMSQFSSVSLLSPGPSAPMTMPSGPLRSAW